MHAPQQHYLALPLHPLYSRIVIPAPAPGPGSHLIPSTAIVLHSLKLTPCSTPVSLPHFLSVPSSFRAELRRAQPALHSV
ncbi:uncharacterized protein LY79DRAFT_237323 [Colletotrichum navitas]|uniref:Uncharacterized protein n=1 Tax=Colletotrichum navitas TaxID=681940 RepID=A0AAD8PX00_9PEZI|nr:uncharacterized protein LY79DRAFT_237323 [Colletotrichum navitas]KAK1589648.1 hypothetical protein LY79DRAFT_237323 [Colletotrichum navitas]